MSGPRKGKVASFRISDEEAVAYESLAKKAGVSRSDWMRAAIGDYLRYLVDYDEEDEDYGKEE